AGGGGGVGRGWGGRGPGPGAGVGRVGGWTLVRACRDMVRLTGLRGVLRRWLVTGRGGTSRIGQDRLVSTVRGRRISVTEPGVGRGCATVRRVGRGGLLPVGPAGCGGAVRCDPAVPIRLSGIVRMPVRAGWLRHCWVLRCCGQTPIGRSEIKSGFA